MSEMSKEDYIDAIDGCLDVIYRLKTSEKVAQDISEFVISEIRSHLKYDTKFPTMPDETDIEYIYRLLCEITAPLEELV